MQHGSEKDSTDAVQVSELVLKNFHALEDNYQRHAGLQAPDYGLEDMNLLLGPMRPGELIVVGARPCSGLNAWLSMLVRHNSQRSEHPCRVAIFSLARSADAVSMHLLLSSASLNARKAERGSFDADAWRRLAGASGAMAEADVWIYGRSGMGVEEIREQCLRLAGRKGPQLVVIDSLQLLAGFAARDNRQQVIQALKALTEELAIPVVVTSELRRGIERRRDKSPRLSDFAAPRALERHADVMIALHRPGLYSTHSSSEGIIALHVLKQPGVITATIPARFDAHTERLDEFDEDA
jgi:replicative DNA helicase